MLTVVIGAAVLSVAYAAYILNSLSAEDFKLERDIIKSRIDSMNEELKKQLENGSIRLLSCR
eukprot:3203472-Prymnesium_polylepis.1